MMLPCRAFFDTLPSEIVLLIIQLAIDKPAYRPGAEYPYQYNHPASTEGSKQPECLAAVCSRWRAIALSYPMLWRHIELSANKSILPALLSCTELRIERSGSMPLEVYIDDAQVQSPYSNFEYDYKLLKQLLVRVAKRMSALRFVIYQEELGSFHSGVFEYIICACSTDHFRELAIIEKNGSRSHGGDFDRLILAHNETWPREPWKSYQAKLELSIPRQELDNVVSHLKILHLEGIFLNWTSTAYCGLVDLRLMAPSTGFPCYIQELDLVSVLAASPRLRTLYLSLTLRGESPDNSVIDPVSLCDLDYLQIISFYTEPLKHSDTMTGSILRLIAPGPKPLQLTLNAAPGPIRKSCFESIHVKEFFRRSRITILCAQDMKLPIDQLFCHGYAPDLSILVTTRCEMDTGASSNLASSLRSWYLRECSVECTRLRRMIELCQEGIVMSNSYVREKTLGGGFKELTRDEISLVYPTIKFLAIDN